MQKLKWRDNRIEYNGNKSIIYYIGRCSRNVQPEEYSQSILQHKSRWTNCKPFAWNVNFKSGLASRMLLDCRVASGNGVNSLDISVLKIEMKLDSPHPYADADGNVFVSFPPFLSQCVCTSVFVRRSTMLEHNKWILHIYFLDCSIHHIVIIHLMVSI